MKNGAVEEKVDTALAASNCHDKESITENPKRPDSSGFLIDMDGVIYKGEHVIEGAKEFITKLIKDDIPFLFLTNNSQRTRRDVAMKLIRKGFDITEDHIFTCAMATARFLAHQKPNGTAFVIGEGGLLHALHRNGYSIVDSDPDYVVVGEGRTFTMEMMEQAVNMILNGAKLITTNPDPSCPTANGTRPGCGAIAAMLERATGVTAFSVGKPNPVMMRMAREQLGLRSSETTMIGDTLATDIVGGEQMGYKTILVLSGGTKEEDLKHAAIQPGMVLKNVGEVIPYLGTAS